MRLIERASRLVACAAAAIGVLTLHSTWGSQVTLTGHVVGLAWLLALNSVIDVFRPRIRAKNALEIGRIVLNTIAALVALHWGGWTLTWVPFVGLCVGLAVVAPLPVQLNEMDPLKFRPGRSIQPG